MKKRLILLLLFSISHINCQVDSKLSFENSKKYTEIKEYSKALFEIDNALKTDSLNREYRLQKIKILYFESDCTNAFFLLGKLIDHDKKFDDETISYFCDLSDCVNESTAATEILTQYVKKKKYKSPEILVKLAQRLYLIKDYENSVNYYKEYIKLNPNDIHAIIDISRILYSLNRIEDLKQTIEIGLGYNKNSIPLLNNLASYYFIKKEYKSAIEVENQIINLQYNIENIRSRAMFYEFDGQIFEAYKDYNKVIELDECYLEYYYKILQYEFQNKLFERVIINSYKAIKCDSKAEDMVLDGLYTSLFFCEKFEDGKKYLDKRIESKPDVFVPYYTKAIILLKDKKYENILTYLDSALLTKDINEENVKDINLLKFGYYLLKEDYDGFIKYWKTRQINSLNNTLNFTFIESLKAKNSEIKISFNKETGSINYSLIIPTKVFTLLKNKYGLEMNISE